LREIALPLVENDIIIVPESGIKNFFNSFVNAVKGFISFGFGRAFKFFEKMTIRL